VNNTHIPPLRNRPPNRRPAVTRMMTWKTEVSSHNFHITIGYDHNSLKPVEVFYADGQTVGSQLQHAIQDACVLISLLLQHGVDPIVIAKSLSTTPIFGEVLPSTVVGVIASAVQDGEL
jgi:hypothetical protein